MLIPLEPVYNLMSQIVQQLRAPFRHINVGAFVVVVVVIVPCGYRLSAGPRTRFGLLKLRVHWTRCAVQFFFRREFMVHDVLWTRLRWPNHHSPRNDSPGTSIESSVIRFTKWTHTTLGWHTLAHILHICTHTRAVYCSQSSLLLTIGDRQTDVLWKPPENMHRVAYIWILCTQGGKFMIIVLRMAIHLGGTVMMQIIRIYLLLFMSNYSWILKISISVFCIVLFCANWYTPKSRVHTQTLSRAHTQIDAMKHCSFVLLYIFCVVGVVRRYHHRHSFSRRPPST